MKTSLLIALLCAASLARAEPAAEPSPRDVHAAECVAALDVNTHELAQQLRSGNEASRSLLQDRLVAGTAFVGDTYLHGSADEHQARALANQALDAQKRLSPVELGARQLACAKEGTRLYDESNPLERVVVKRLAKKRLEKLLGS